MSITANPTEIPTRAILTITGVPPALPVLVAGAKRSLVANWKGECKEGEINGQFLIHKTHACRYSHLCKSIFSFSLFVLAKSKQKPWKLPRQFSPTAKAEGETAGRNHPNALCQPFVIPAAIAGKFPGQSHLVVLWIKSEYFINNS